MITQVASFFFLVKNEEITKEKVKMSKTIKDIKLS